MIWPAIDLMDGRCVRLHKGDFAQKSLYDTDPLARAKAFADAGAQALHVVDLDGAKAGAVRQSALICDLAAKSGLKVQAGGGVRSGDDIEALLDGGVSRVIIGSLAVSAPKAVKTWLKTFGADRLVLALDIRLVNGVPMPAIKGWQEEAAISLWDVLDGFGGQATNLLVTDIDRDGVLGGANAALYADIKARYGALSLLASGGIGSLDDIRAVQAVGADGVIIGKALYENKFSLQEALSCWPGA
ncbi:MAG: 1-(5-phosphoribosyl)-5-[(5-phosphoribosylamino)methylideneamino]imidazole-4-carboxamide isomerase [Robiginitomaculum sp.]|nr:MAG: 1-(5-phosphoribosyl)-5-[(5-phosphoribosylamino)methylideneamino]imidazole-4-carboxamide isomerase [Robiginitomaculum sp.]